MGNVDIDTPSTGLIHHAHPWAIIPDNTECV